MMSCPVCNHEMTFLFKAMVLNRYDVSYFKCTYCGLIQTEKPYWLKDAYSSAISSLDVGLVQRNINLSISTEWIISKYFNATGKFLDYAGGYGLFVRMMRDKGFDFYRQDIYCENIFAQHHDLKDLDSATRFDLITAFEVMEHLENPMEEITQMLKYGDVIFFTTEIQKSSFKNHNDWWYFLPETGQHISFYSSESFNLIAKRLNCFYYSDGCYSHILSAKKLPSNPFVFNNKNLIHKIFGKLFKLKHPLNQEVSKKSLIQKDFESAKKKLKNG